MLVNQSYVDDLDTLFHQARHVHPHFAALVERLSRETGGVALVALLKTRARAEAKAKFKYTDSLGAVSWFRLTDIVRGTLVCGTIDAMYDAVQQIVELLGVAPARGDCDGVRELNVCAPAARRAGELGRWWPWPLA